MRRIALFALCCGLLAPSSRAEEAKGLSEAAFDYVGGATLSMFYHELGHALIDTMDLPLYGPEEDAADTLAAVMSHMIWNEDGARRNMRAFAQSWLASAAESEVGLEDYASAHALDLQRHYRQVCLFYGASPETRADFAEEFALPPARAETCEEEYEQADRSWGELLRERGEVEGERLVWSGPTADSTADPIAALLAQEVEDVNKVFSQTEEISVQIEACGEANAFYKPEEKAVVICREFVEYLTGQAEEMGL